MDRNEIKTLSKQQITRLCDLVGRMMFTDDMRWFISVVVLSKEFPQKQADKLYNKLLSMLKGTDRRIILYALATMLIELNMEVLGRNVDEQELMKILNETDKEYAKHFIKNGWHREHGMYQ